MKFAKKQTGPVYDKDVKVPSAVISKRGQVADFIVEGERIVVPTFEIGSYPQVRFSQVKERRYNLIDRAQQRAKLDLMTEEDRNVFNTIEASASAVNPPTVVANRLTRDALVSALAEIGKWDLVPAKFVMNYSEYSDILTFGRDQFDPVTQREVLQTGLVGHLWTLDLLVSKVVPRGTVYCIAEPEFTGIIPIRLEKILADLKFGYMLGNLLEEGNQQERSIMSDVMEILRDYTPNTSKSDDIVRTANINKIAEPDRNDLVISTIC